MAIYYIGYAWQVNNLINEDYGLADYFFSDWEPAHGWGIQFPDEDKNAGNIYRADSEEEFDKRKINLGHEGVYILDKNNVKEFLGKSYDLLDNDKEYFYKYDDDPKKRLILELDKCGKVTSGNLYEEFDKKSKETKMLAVKIDGIDLNKESGNLYEEFDEKSKKDRILSVKIDGIDLNKENVRILKFPLDGSYGYILYFNIEYIVRNKGFKSLMEMVQQIDYISKDPYNDTYCDDNIINLFNEIDDNFKERPMSVESFLDRKMAFNVSTEKLIY